MIFCITADSNLTETRTMPECDVALFGFNGLSEVDYEQELKGETDGFDQVAKLSKSLNCGILCGCRTVSRGMLRKSVAVADRGKLLGISDMNHVLDGEDYKSGACIGFYKVNGCKIGLCIENDFLFPDAVKALATCGCNVVVAVLEEIHDNIPPLIARAYAFLYGMPVIMCAGKTAYFADTTGAIATSTRGQTVFEISPQNRYHLVTTRQKGITAQTPTDY